MLLDCLARSLDDINHELPGHFRTASYQYDTTLLQDRVYRAITLGCRSRLEPRCKQRTMLSQFNETDSLCGQQKDCYIVVDK